MSKAFTLVELMVVTAIMVLLTTLVLFNYRAGAQQLALDRATQKLAQDIRRAQEMAMSATVCEPCGDVVPEGYGVTLHRTFLGGTKYRIYADDGDETFNDSSDILIGAPIDLEKGVFIKRIQIEFPVANCLEGIVNFRPPDPVVNISSNGPPRDGKQRLEIILALEADPSKTKTIKVNNAGLIYVE